MPRTVDEILQQADELAARIRNELVRYRILCRNVR